MDVFFSYGSVTDIPFYNCSALSIEELDRLHGIQRPIRGVVTFSVGVAMILIYIACLRVMVKLALIQKACYKIMFVMGLYEIAAVLINDIFIAYSLTLGLTFCDAPNTFYTVGCFHIATWAGASYFCLYLAFNRIIEILKLRRKVIEFFFCPSGTAIGILIGFLYTLSFVFFITPAIFSNDVATTIINPLGLEMLASFKIRHTLMIANNCGVVSVTVIIYGIFCIILRKKFKDLGFRDSQNRLQHQVFIQSTLICGFNFFICTCYAFFLFISDNIIFPQICYFVYQFTSGLQALVYLLFNRTILDGVKDDFIRLVGISHEVTTELRTAKIRDNTSSQPETNVVSFSTAHDT